MICTRCAGRLVRELIGEPFENDGQVYFGAWRWAYQCGACGRLAVAVQEAAIVSQSVQTAEATGLTFTVTEVHHG